MILTRNQSHFQRKVQLGNEIVSRTVEANSFVNPYCHQKVTSYNLALLLHSLHQQKNLTLKNSLGAYIPGAKKLLEIVESKDAVECLMLSARYAKYPWSFKFVLKLAEDYFVCDKKEGMNTNQIIEDICNG